MKTPDTTSNATLRTKHVAAKFGLKPMHLRRILRSMPTYADGVHTNYAWDPADTKALAAIEAAIKKAADDKAKRAEAAKAALLKKQADVKAQAQLK